MVAIGTRLVVIVAAMAAGGAGNLACEESTALPEPSLAGGETAQTSKESPAEPPASAIAATEVHRELMARWNAVAPLEESTFDFRWTAFDQFPHPTYQGGSPESYRAFATVLLAFLQHGDNFDFLTRNRLFTLHLVYVFPSGQIGLDTTFQALATAFAAPDGFGDIPADTRKALQEIADRIQPQEPATPVDLHPDSAATSPDTDDATMCRHYCETLHETNIYACMKAGNDATTCRDRAPTADKCFELRCVPGLVPASLCLTQCESLRIAYDAVCTTTTAPAGLCPSLPVEHDRVCRDGCTTPTEP